MTGRIGLGVTQALRQSQTLVSGDGYVEFTAAVAANSARICRVGVAETSGSELD